MTLYVGVYRPPAAWRPRGARWAFLRLNAEAFSGNRFGCRCFGNNRTLFGTFGSQPRLGFGPFALGAITSSATATAAAATFCRLAGLNRVFEIRRDAKRIIGRVGLRDMIGARL